MTEIPAEYIDRLFTAQLEATGRGVFLDDKNLELLLSISNITNYRDRPAYEIPMSFEGLFKSKELYNFIVDKMVTKLKFVDPKTLQWKGGRRNAVSVGFLKELQAKKYFKESYKNIELSFIANRFFGLSLNEDHFKGSRHPATDTPSIPFCTL